MLKQRTLCLIPIPFSDLSSNKKRPVVIISNNEYNNISEDVLVMGLTSNLQIGEYNLPLKNTDLESGNLIKTSMIRVDKIYSINKSLVLKLFGVLSETKYFEVTEKLAQSLSNNKSLR
jgi:mRNA interferase MazF